MKEVLSNHDFKVFWRPARCVVQIERPAVARMNELIMIKMFWRQKIIAV